jgi:hypothetical protein
LSLDLSSTKINTHAFTPFSDSLLLLDKRISATSVLEARRRRRRRRRKRKRRRGKLII